VIIYDRLIGDSALDGCPRGMPSCCSPARRGGGDSVPQEQDRSADDRARARDGKSVVRLKGGDPFVFGRGGEEALTLRAARHPLRGRPPGVTAGVAALAYAGIPVTHRGLATAVAFVTGAHGRRQRARLGTRSQRFPGTLVFYMGVARPGADRRFAGRRRARPVRARGGGGRRGHCRHSGPSSPRLQTIAGAACSARGVGSPSITVVGAVAGLAEKLGLGGTRAARRSHGGRDASRRRRARPSRLARRPAPSSAHAWVAGAGGAYEGRSTGPAPGPRSVRPGSA